MRDRNKASRPSEAILREVGWVTVRWSALETYIDLLNAYIFTKANFSRVDKLPRPFNQRVRFIRQSLRDPLFINLRPNGEMLLDRALALSKDRNNAVHCVVTRWRGDREADQILLKLYGEKYFAVTDTKLSLQGLKDLAWSIYQTEVGLFNFSERFKSVIALWHGDGNFFDVGYLHERQRDQRYRGRS